MRILVLFLWVISAVLLGIAAFLPPGIKLFEAGVFFFDLWLGLQFLIDSGEVFTF